jgi:hypothetical protein
MKSLVTTVTKQLSSLQSQSQTYADNINSILSSIGTGLTTSVSNITTKTKGINSHKSGLDYVPYDGYLATLHKGEAVLTAEENANRNSNNGASNQFYFYGTPPLDEKETVRQMKLAQQQLILKWS